MAFLAQPSKLAHILTRRYIAFAAGLLITVFCICNWCHGATFYGPLGGHILKTEASPSNNVFKKLDMTEKECRKTFPGLLDEVDRSSGGGKFQLERAVDDYMGLVQGRISGGKLYIISHEKKPNRDMLFERTAVLHAIHRAILTTPSREPLPNTTFALTILDTPRNNTWSFARPNLPSLLADGNHWLMPHFSSWSWPLPFIGTLDEALSKIQTVENSLRWEDKTEKVVWRGTAWFNSVGNRDLRPKLLEKTKGKEWADVQTLKWESNGEKAGNAISIEGFCRFKYVVYTEGITYSGRLPFHQACESVLITPPLTYLLHTTHLMRPVFSSSILRPKKPLPKNPRWPHSYPVSEANVVFVDSEWNDLEATIQWLKANDKIARNIARRQRVGLVDNGYLSEAAEVCYWRGLIRAWASVAKPSDKEWSVGGGKGMRWETFSLLGKMHWD